MVQQRNHHFVTLSLGEMATVFTICIQDSKYSGERGADFMCVCVRAGAKQENGAWRKDTTVNCVKYLMSQTLLIISNVKDYHGQGTWCL